MAAPLKFNRLLDSFAGPQLRRDVSAALFAAADDVRALSRYSITAGSVGGANHVPSAPGEPPNNDTGNLIASHETAMPAWNHAQVIVRAPYAVPLEEGSSRAAGVTSRSFAGKTTTYGPSKAKQGPVKVEFGDSSTEARPFLGPATRASRKDFEKRLKLAIQQAAARAAASVGGR